MLYYVKAVSIARRIGLINAENKNHNAQYV
jgi:hypothetical protein